MRLAGVIRIGQLFRFWVFFAPSPSSPQFGKTRTQHTYLVTFILHLPLTFIFSFAILRLNDALLSANSHLLSIAFDFTIRASSIKGPPTNWLFGSPVAVGNGSVRCRCGSGSLSDEEEDEESDGEEDEESIARRGVCSPSGSSRARLAVLAGSLRCSRCGRRRVPASVSMGGGSSTCI